MLAEFHVPVKAQGAVAGVGTAAAGQYRLPARTLRGGGGFAALHRHRAGHQKEWRILLHSPAVSVSQVSQAKLSRVRQGKHFVEPLGGGLLPPTTDQRLSASDGGARAGLQMAARHLPLLAEPHGVSGRNLRSGLAQTWRSTFSSLYGTTTNSLWPLNTSDRSGR